MSTRAERRVALIHAVTSALVLVSSAALFSLIGRFTLVQAVVLAIGFEALRQGVLSIRRQLAFQPFELSIRPNWNVIADTLTTDVLSSGVTAIEHLRSRVAQTPMARRLFEEGVRVTFLERAKCYIHQGDIFASSAALSLSLVEDAETRTSLALLEASYGPDGYKVVISVRPETPSSHAEAAADGIQIAALPLSLMKYLFWNVGSYGNLCRELSGRGWEVREADAMFERPFSLRNDYATISIRVL